MPNNGGPVRHARKVGSSEGSMHTFLQSSSFLQGPECGLL